mgnify:CR=1 FL=1
MRCSAFSTIARPRPAPVAAVRAGRSLDEIDGWLPAAPFAHLRSPAEQLRRFARYPGAVERTVDIAAACGYAQGALEDAVRDGDRIVADVCRYAKVPLFEAGQNDWVFQLPPGTYEKYRQQNPKETRNAPMIGLRYYSFQTQSPAFKDVRVRKALQMSVDKDKMCKELLRGTAKPAWSMISPATVAYDPATRSTRSFDLQFRDNRWEICQAG